MYIKVYFILAHKNPVQLSELVSLLDDGKSLFFIHLDAKMKQENFKERIPNVHCHFIKKRERCSWGTFSLVQATLNGMKEVSEYMNANYSGFEYHFIMLSGECLPLKSNNYLHQFLESNRNISFLHYWQLPYDKWFGGGWFRVEKVYWFSYKKHPKWNYWVNRIVKKLRLDFLSPLNRFKKLFSQFHFYGNSQWMILEKDLIDFVFGINQKYPEFNAVFKYTLAPDEMYFSTLILNFGKKHRFKINNSPSHLVLFKGSESSPQYLSIENISQGSEQTLFARKFDPAINNVTMTYIKQNRLP